MNKPPRVQRPSFFRQLLNRFLRLLGTPAYWLIRRLGYKPTAPVPIEVLPISSVPSTVLLSESLLPDGWTRPRQMQAAKPTTAPVLLAFGLCAAALGLLITTWSILILGLLIAVLGGGMWAWDSFQETTPQDTKPQPVGEKS